MICFYAWGTKINGGVQNLIINLSIYFAEQNNPVTIIGYNYCYIINKLNDQNINYIFLDIEKNSFSMIEKKLIGKVLVLTSFRARFGLKKMYKVNTKVLFWNVFPEEIININKLGPINLKFLTSKLIKYLLDNNGCVFMDGFCYNAALKFNNKLNLIENEKKFLPIPLKIESKNKYVENNKNITSLNISYIGRATIWKIMPLIKFIDDLKKIKFHFPINIFIISQEIDLYHEKLNDIDLPINFKIFYKNNLSGLTYLDFLKTKIDLNISMGTAALDSASLGIPTILIDYSHTKMPQNYKYNWLFETKKFGLGDMAKNTKNNHILDKILQPYKDNNVTEIKNISILCYNYVRFNHSIENISLKLVDRASKTSAQARVLYKYSPLVNNSLILSILKLYNKTINRSFSRENT